MKIALIIFGIHYNKCIKHWAGPYYGIDYKKSIDNYKMYLWDYFKDDTIDVFFSTYKSEKSNDLLKDYKPKAYNFFPELQYTKGKKRIGKNSNMIKATKLCLDYKNKNKINYDLCIITRFDLIFTRKLNETNLDISKFNVSFNLKTKHKICDNFYVMPFKYLNNFHKIILNFGISNNHHYLLKPLTEKYKINFIFDENQTTLHNKLYYINRIIPDPNIIASMKQKEQDEQKNKNKLIIDVKKKINRNKSLIKINKLPIDNKKSLKKNKLLIIKNKSLIKNKKILKYIRYIAVVKNSTI